MIKNLFILLTLIFSINADILQFEIYKSFANDPHDSNRVNLGILEIRRNIQYNQIQTSIRPNFPLLVSQNDLKQSSVILTFVPKKVSDLQHDNKVYKTSVIQKIAGSHDQIIGVVVGLDFKIKAINYLEKRSPLQQIRSEVIKMEAGKQQMLKIQNAIKKGGPQGQGGQQQQSFFSKWKWPIIITLVVFYLMNSAGGGQQAQAQGQQGAQ